MWQDGCKLIHYGMELVKAKRTIDNMLRNLYSAVTFYKMYHITTLAAINVAGARKRRAVAGQVLTAQNRGISQEYWTIKNQCSIN